MGPNALSPGPPQSEPFKSASPFANPPSSLLPPPSSLPPPPAFLLPSNPPPNNRHCTPLPLQPPQLHQSPLHKLQVFSPGIPSAASRRVLNSHLDPANSVDFEMDRPQHQQKRMDRVFDFLGVSKEVPDTQPLKYGQCRPPDGVPVSFESPEGVLDGEQIEE